MAGGKSPKVTAAPEAAPKATETKQVTQLVNSVVARRNRASTVLSSGSGSGSYGRSGKATVLGGTS